MNKKVLSLISSILACTILAGTLAACNGPEEENSSMGIESEAELPSKSGNIEELPENNTATISETIAEDNTETDSETEPDTTPKLDVDNAELIEYADRLANAVDVHYSDTEKSAMIIQNANMTLEYELRGEKAQLVSSLKNVRGKPYFENSMNVFVKMKSGSTYYSSNTSIPTATNIYRLGYYYYDVRLENEDFAPMPEALSELSLSLKTSGYKHLTKPKLRDGELITMVQGGNDPYLVFTIDPYSAEKYTYFSISIKVDSNKRDKVDVYFMSDDLPSYSDMSKVTFPPYHRRRIPHLHGLPLHHTRLQRHRQGSANRLFRRRGHALSYKQRKAS